MIDYEKLKRLFNETDRSFIDNIINNDINLISEIDSKMIEKGFCKITEEGKYSSLMNERERKLFLTTKSIATDHIRFLTKAVQVLLEDNEDKKKIHRLEKECDTLKTCLDVKDLEIDRLSQPLPDKLRQDGLL